MVHTSVSDEAGLLGTALSASDIDFQETVWRFPKRLNTDLSYGLALLLNL